MESINDISRTETLEFRPAWGTGWETVLDHSEREIRMQFKLFGLRLPLRRQVPYSDVVNVITAKQSTSTPRWRDRLRAFEPFWASVLRFQQRGGRPHVTGWRLRTMLTIREKRPVTLPTTFSSPHDAREFEARLRE